MLPRGRVFYGWYVVYAICFAMTAICGLAFHNLSVLLNAFVTQRGFPIGLASGATASYFIAAGLGGMLAGRLIDRFDPRPIMIAGACVSALALGCVGLLRTPLAFYGFHVVFGFCYGCCGMVPATTIVARWFEAQRPLAMSIATTGLSLGGILVTPASAFMIAHWGLSGAAPWLGLAMALGVVPATALVVRASPQAMGLRPDGAADPRGAASPAPARSIPFAHARRSRFLYRRDDCLHFWSRLAGRRDRAPLSPGQHAGGHRDRGIGCGAAGGREPGWTARRWLDPGPAAGAFVRARRVRLPDAGAGHFGAGRRPAPAAGWRRAFWATC
jgi:MFS family permease